MDGVNENVIEWLRGDTIAAITAPNSSRLKGQVVRLAEKYPEEVEIRVRNKDGSIFAHVPVSYVSIRKPRQVDYTEEQREQIAERLKRGKDARSIVVQE